MFIVVLFGYKQTKVFTIDCLTASLIDCIWTNCLKEILKNINVKEELLTKEQGKFQKRLAKLEKTLEETEKKIKDEEEKKANEEAQNKKVK